ncbi:MAG: Arc family DNA-binding protein [Pseudomonadales bacterium]
MTEKNYKYLVRLPTSLRDRLATSAAQYRRSLNSDIIARLQQTFGDAPIEPGPVVPGFPATTPMAGGPRELTVEEFGLVRRFRGLSPSKRAALMDLLS